MVLSRNKKNNVYPYKPKFYYIKVGFKGSKLYRHVFVMAYSRAAAFACIDKKTSYFENFQINTSESVQPTMSSNGCMHVQYLYRPSPLVTFLLVALVPEEEYVVLYLFTPGWSPAYLFGLFFCKMCMHSENIGFLPVLWGS